jgi:predicted cupin superfamily sugar epimerase
MSLDAVPQTLHPRAAELVRGLALAPHPEGGFYREVFRSTRPVQPADDRPARPGLTTIDFLLGRGQCSAWHRVRSDEVWHLLEGGPLRLWTMPPAGDRIDTVTLGPGGPLRHVVPADAWQAAEPLGDYAYAGATVGPGFDFADFAFGRDDPAVPQALKRLAPDLLRLL